MSSTDQTAWTPTYSPWRHGGWYVDNVHYPSGAVGCVSRNYADRKWRIVCDPRPFETAPTFRNRDAAARAERELAAATPTYTAPCGIVFDRADDASAHQGHCDQCAGVLEPIMAHRARALEACMRRHPASQSAKS